MRGTVTFEEGRADLGFGQQREQVLGRDVLVEALAPCSAAFWACRITGPGRYVYLPFHL